MNATKIADLAKKILLPGRSLLLPMLLLALGLHAALLAMPLPSSEAVKEAEDKKNPITINQIPTDQPRSAATTTSSASVNVPDLPDPPAVSDPNATAPTPAETTADSDSSSAIAASSVPAKVTQSSPRSAASMSSASTPATDSASAEPTTPETTTDPQAAATVAANSAAEVPNGAGSNPFAEFPHFQPSEADCYGLGFGENCRVVNQGAIAQVTDYFKQELAAKDFTANLVADEPARKVFKVTKGDKTLFLNIWQSKDQVSYLLSRVVVKQSPADIKTDAEK